MRTNAEPWRYRCPEGHVAVVERGLNRARGGKEPESRFYCNTCKDDPALDPHHDRVVDAKTGRVVPA